MEQLNPVQGNSKKVFFKFSVALFELKNVLGVRAVDNL